jgi:hypothetical protein
MQDEDRENEKYILKYRKRQQTQDLKRNKIDHHLKIPKSLQHLWCTSERKDREQSTSNIQKSNKLLIYKLAKEA